MECKRNKWDCEEGGGDGCFQKGKFELFALTETKLKETGKVSWRRVNGMITGVQWMERARKGVAILLNDFGCISSRILWVKFKFSRVKVCEVV